MAALQRAARSVETTVAKEASPQALQAVALSKVALGDLEAAAALLERAVSAANETGLQGAPSLPASLWSDLASAYLGLAHERGAPHLGLRALAAAQRAVAADGAAPAARFNRALALEYLGLTAGARAAWRHYLEREADPGWAAEGRRHLEALSGPTEEGLWASARRRFAAAARRGEGEVMGEIARRFPLRTRWYGERELLGRWAEEVLAGRGAEAQQSLGLARQVSRTLADVRDETLLADAVRAIEKAAEEDRSGALLLRLARGQRAFLAGLDLYFRFETTVAREQLARAGDLLAEAGSPMAHWAALFYAACLYQERLYGEALAALEALELALGGRPYRSVLGRVFWIRGLILYIEGRYGSALLSYRRALELFEAAGEPEHAAAARQLVSEYFWIVGDREGAWRHLHAALEVVDRVPTPRRRQAIYEMAAVLAAEEGDPAIALYFQEEAVRAAVLAGSPEGAAISVGRLAQLQDQTGRAGEARTTLQLAHELQLAVEDPPKYEIIAGDLALLEGRMALAADPLRALPLFEDAVTLYRETDYEAGLLRAFAARAAAARAAHRWQEAEAGLREGLQLAEVQWSEVPAGKRVVFADSRRELLEQMLALQVGVRRRPDVAFSWAERGRGRELQHRLGERAARVGRGGGPGREGVAVEGLTPGDVAAALPPGVALVEMAALEDQLLVWVIHRGESRFLEREVGAAELARRVERFRASMDGPDGEAVALGSELYRLLFGDLLGGEEEIHHLILVPDGSLHHLPFAALTNPVTGRYLVEEHTLQVAPSARLVVRGLERGAGGAGVRASGSVERRLGAADRVLLVGDPVIAPELVEEVKTLREAGPELAAIAELYGGARVLAGRDATVAALRLRAEEAQILHLATHARFGGRDPDLAHILLTPEGGDPGALYAHEIYDWRLPATRLVFLSACSTAAGPISASEGPLSLARPFLAAGVPAVIATLWDVDDRDAARLAVETHRHLAAGTPPAAALRRAQLALLHGEEPRYKSPAAWAGFVVLETGISAN